MTVHVSVEDGPYTGIDPRSLRRRAAAMLAALQMQDRELSILLTGDDQIQILNRIYRKKNRPTDVLAFPQEEGEGGPPGAGLSRDVVLLGDVVVSVPTAARQASARGVGLAEEVTMLLAHGLLHLLGWDHDTAAKDRRMRLETERLCAVATAGAGRRVAPRPAVKGATRVAPIAIRRR